MLPPASEALSIEDAIQAYTINGAHLIGMEKLIGSIEVGKRADLVVVDGSPFGASPEQIAKIRVVTTMMNGRIVHELAKAPKEPHDLDEIFEDFDCCSSEGAGDVHEFVKSEKK